MSKFEFSDQWGPARRVSLASFTCLMSLMRIFSAARSSAPRFARPQRESTRDHTSRSELPFSGIKPPVVRVGTRVLVCTQPHVLSREHQHTHTHTHVRNTHVTSALTQIEKYKPALWEIKKNIQATLHENVSRATFQ